MPLNPMEKPYETIKLRSHTELAPRGPPDIQHKVGK